jgi:hypothetical protein
MAVLFIYRWDYIDQNASAGVFVHGFSKHDVGAFSAIPYELGGGTAFTPLFDITLSQGEVSIHVDNTYARTAHVQNLAPFNPVTADLFWVGEQAPN